MCLSKTLKNYPDKLLNIISVMSAKRKSKRLWKNLNLVYSAIVQHCFFIPLFQPKNSHMAEAIQLGRMTDTMEEGFIAELNIKAGDKIKSGDAIAEIETDKATMTLESYVNGVVLHIA